MTIFLIILLISYILSLLISLDITYCFIKDENSEFIWYNLLYILCFIPLINLSLIVNFLRALIDYPELKETYKKYSFIYNKFFKLWTK